MSEHPIRLRAAWQCHDLDSPASPAFRLDLPLVWPEAGPARVRLVRSFNRPPIDPAREHLVLCLERVPGLLAVRLNDQELVLSPALASLARRADRLPPLPARSVLALDVDTRAAAASSGDLAWGEVALVIVAGQDPAR